MSRVRIGVVGCGAIAQVQHLPFLAELSEEFEVAAVCDASPSQAAYAARQFHVERHYTDYRELLDSDVDAVLLCHSDPKTEAIIASVDAGKHAFVEKPICYSLEEADAIIEASARSGKVVQAGYTKLFEPAYELAQREVAAINDVRFVQVNHLHPNNDLHVRQFRTRRFDDLPETAVREAREALDAACRAAIGDVPPRVLNTFHSLAGSLIHDLYCLRGMFGVPSRVVSTEIWADGRAYSTTLEYPEGHRCVATWVDLPDLWDFHETLEVYGGSKRVIVKFGTGFSRTVSTLAVQEIDADGRTVRKEPAVDWENPFRRELRHFHDSIVNGTPNRSPIKTCRDDVALVIDITKAYLSGGPILRTPG